MIQLPTNHSRTVFYCHSIDDSDFLNGIKDKNWMSLIYCEKFAAKKHKEILKQIIELNPLFIYCVGSNYPDLEECVISELCEKHTGFTDDTPDLPLTYSDNDLKGAIKFCVESAFHESKEINEVVIIDLNEVGLTKGELKKL